MDESGDDLWMDRLLIGPGRRRDEQDIVRVHRRRRRRRVDNGAGAGETAEQDVLQQGGVAPLLRVMQFS
jgi:hypothetical protein